MLVVSNKQKLVINTKSHAEILAVIPHAKPFTHGGKKLIAVPHRIEECLVLKNMGFTDVPSPILSYYNWPGRFSPMDHQKKTAAFLLSHRRGLVLSDPGTGKTASCLWAADYLLDVGLIKRVLIVAPLSILRSVWANEIRTFIPHREYALVTGTREQRLQALDTAGAEFYDEATALKNPTTNRFRQFYFWVTQHNPWLWMLTGTPIAQSPVDAWSLARLVGNPSVRRTYTGFKDQVMTKVSRFKWVPNANALAICDQVLSPRIRFSLDECVDLPDMVYENRETDMTLEQQKAFREMREKAVVAAHNITAANAAVMLSKLVQICCGVVYDRHGNEVMLDANPRLEALCEVLDELGGRAIVYVPLRSVQEWLNRKLKERYNVRSVHGDVSAKLRTQYFKEFQTESTPMVLLAHPAVTAHGVTLTAANTIVWFAPIYSLEKYEQANARIRRVGTKGKTRAVHLYGTAFERELYGRLANKRKVLTDFLELVRTE